MTARRVIFPGAAVGVLLTAFPASAQPEMTYEYARPQPQGEVVYRREPVVQPVPAPAQPAEVHRRAAPYIEDARDYPSDAEEYEYEYEYERAYDDHGGYVEAAPPAPVVHAPTAPHGYARFDRQAWLEDCRDRYRSQDGKRRNGGIIGGLLGAATGGLIGNRVADGERLAGTLIGAGVGGLAGLAIGSAVNAATDRDEAADYCESWLNQHRQAYAPAPAQAYPHPGPYAYAQPAAGYYGAGCACGPAMAYMPVLVAVPQRAVVREYVTEEWVEAEPAPRAKKRRIQRPAPRGDKRIKYVKGH